MRRLLFLDFDGVLHPTSAAPHQLFCRVGLLSEALAGSDCLLVVSSSWRHHHELATLTARFPVALRERIIAATGEPRFGRWPRYQEILAFVRESPGVRSWRALDDSWSEFPPSCSELIACDPNTGLEIRQVNSLRDWLLDDH